MKYLFIKILDERVYKKLFELDAESKNIDLPTFERMAYGLLEQAISTYCSLKGVSMKKMNRIVKKITTKVEKVSPVNGSENKNPDTSQKDVFKNTLQYTFKKNTKLDIFDPCCEYIGDIEDIDIFYYPPGSPFLETFAIKCLLSNFCVYM